MPARGIWILGRESPFARCIASALAATVFLSLFLAPAAFGRNLYAANLELDNVSVIDASTLQLSS
jgi:hypothetical protein